jgi:hypothetical protein
MSSCAFWELAASFLEALKYVIYFPTSLSKSGPRLGLTSAGADQ